MAKRIDQLPAASAVNDGDLFVLEQSGAAMSLTGSVLEAWLLSMADGHGGIASWTLISTTQTDPVVKTYRMTYADGNYEDIAISDGRVGPTGATGSQGVQGPAGPQGIQGPTGPQGGAGTVVPADGQYGFSIDGSGHLILTYVGSTAPSFSIDENGHLILELEE